MDRKDIERFIGKRVKLEKKTTDPNRVSFKLFGIIESVSDTSVVLITDHVGVISLSEIVSIEENNHGY
jgi:hypothetical protein